MDSKNLFEKKGSTVREIITVGEKEMEFSETLNYFKEQNQL
jgi:hypothetical protein